MKLVLAVSISLTQYLENSRPMDHIHSISSIIRTRPSKGKPTFAGFIDFTKHLTGCIEICYILNFWKLVSVAISIKLYRI